MDETKDQVVDAVSEEVEQPKLKKHRVLMDKQKEALAKGCQKKLELNQSKKNKPKVSVDVEDSPVLPPMPEKNPVLKRTKKERPVTDEDFKEVDELISNSSEGSETDISDEEYPSESSEQHSSESTTEQPVVKKPRHSKQYKQTDKIRKEQRYFDPLARSRHRTEPYFL